VAKPRRSEGPEACGHQTTSSGSGGACVPLAAASVATVFRGPKPARSVGLTASRKDVMRLESEKQFLSCCGLSFIGGENIAPKSVSLYPIIFLLV